MTTTNAVGGARVTLRDLWNGTYAAGGGAATWYVSQRLAAIMAWAFLELRVSPNLITLVGGGMSVLASTLFVALPHGIQYAALCMVLYQTAYCLDCADGQVARASRRTSEFGAWLDVAVDLATQLVLAFALLLWLAPTHGPSNIVALSAVIVLAIGRVLLVVTGKYTASYKDPERRAERRSRLKSMLWLVLDAPVLLAIICLLRDKPTALTGYVLFMGLAYLANSIYLARSRL